MADLVELKNKLSELTILEMAELVKTLEQEWGVSAVAPVAVAGASANVSADAGAEKSTVDVVLASAETMKKKLEEAGATVELK